ncbi:MAG: PAS domain-containing protein [bacterium]|nr:PAS domain-containing protein [bacterium]
MERQRLLRDLISGGEDWLIARILRYAKERDYTQFTSTLEEAWRLSIEGLSHEILSALDLSDDVPELGPDEDYPREPLAAFGILEAQRHRARGIPLGMFLGLMKYYEQSYEDLVVESDLPQESKGWAAMFVRRCFDRMELGFCMEWAGLADELRVEELQRANRDMTNEKNRYLTVFESLASAVFLLDQDRRIVNLNHAAAGLLGDAAPTGVAYYGGRHVDTELPWLAEELTEFEADGGDEMSFEKAIETPKGPRRMSIQLRRMLDVSDKFAGTTVILHDVTKRMEAEMALAQRVADLREAMKEIGTLRGLLPVCSYCHRIRDDRNLWSQMEAYISKHSEAQFSHGVCPECYEEHFGGRNGSEDEADCHRPE